MTVTTAFNRHHRAIRPRQTRSPSPQSAPIVVCLLRARRSNARNAHVRTFTTHTSSRATVNGTNRVEFVASEWGQFRVEWSRAETQVDQAR